MILHDKIASQLPALRDRVKKLVTEHGDKIIDQVKLSQIYGGMRGIKSLVTDVSFVDPATGIKLRGMSIPELLEKLPKNDGMKIPYVGGLYYLLLIGEIPTLAEGQEVEKEWAKRSQVPGHVYSLIQAMPTPD